MEEVVFLITTILLILRRELLRQWNKMLPPCTGCGNNHNVIHCALKPVVGNHPDFNKNENKMFADTYAGKILKKRGIDPPLMVPLGHHRENMQL